jgi:hypothetical protein
MFQKSWFDFKVASDKNGGICVFNWTIDIKISSNKFISLFLLLKLFSNSFVHFGGP